MGFLHPNELLAGRTIDGINIQALDPLPFRLRDGRLLRTKALAWSDGLSAPHFLKFKLQTTNSYYPARAHDGFYRDDLEISRDNGVTWQPYPVPRTNEAKDDADCALRELLVDNGVSESLAQAMFEAVQLGGDPAWRERGGKG